MQSRVLASKTFNSGVVSNSMMYKGMPLTRGFLFRYGDGAGEETDVFFLRNVPETISLNCDVLSAKKFFEEDDVLSAFVISEGECGFRNLADQFKEGTLLKRIEDDSEFKSALIKLGTSMFGKTNPKTKSKDVFSSDKNAPYIPFVVVSGALPPQLDYTNNTYFNPNGVVEVSRALDSLNALANGYASDKNRSDSIDRVSSKDDFFNEGYNKCLDSEASPFYRLFNRSELMTPITMAELSYLIVVCFKDFRDIYGSAFGHSSNGNFVGINLNWEVPNKLIKAYRSKYSDMSDYVVTKCSIETYTNDGSVRSVLDVDIKSYLKGRTMTDFRQDVLSGKSAIPLPYLMSMLELHQLDILVFDKELAPLKEVSRGEFAGILVRLASKLYN